MPQQVAQLDEHPVRGLDVAVHQRRNRVQGVEEEVRVELTLQRLQLRFDQPRLELRFRALVAGSGGSRRTACAIAMIAAPVISSQSISCVQRFGKIRVHWRSQLKVASSSGLLVASSR